MKTIERTMLAFVIGYILCLHLEEPANVCLSTALMCAFVPAFLEGLHKQMWVKIKGWLYG